MATKPDKTNWKPDAGDIIEPTGSKKLTGFLADERPPYQFFNWFWNAKRLWENWLAPAVRHNVIISDNADEQDYASLAAYIAAGATAGDRVLITNNQVIAVQIVVPSNITLCIQDGVKFTSAIDLANSLLEFGSNVITEGVLVLELSHTGVVNSGIELNGDGNNLDIVINNTSTGTLAVGVLVNVAKIANLLGGEVKNTGAGAVTTVLNDLSLDESNIVVIRDSINNIIERSLGAISFLRGFTMDLGSDADGDIYYRDSGILKRLAKGTNGQQLVLASGIPAWEDQPEGEGYIHLRDEKAAGTNGGAATLGSWETRDLTVESSDTNNNCSLAANQFTLDAGTYRINARAPGDDVSFHKARLYNITDASVEIVGSSANTSNSADSEHSDSDIRGRFTIASAKVFEIQHRVASNSGTGHGQAVNWDSLVEVYTEVELFKE